MMDGDEIERHKASSAAMVRKIRRKGDAVKDEIDLQLDSDPGLVQYLSETDYFDKWNPSPFHVAAELNCLQIFQMLVVKYKIPVNSTYDKEAYEESTESEEEDKGKENGNGSGSGNGNGNGNGTSRSSSSKKKVDRESKAFDEKIKSLVQNVEQLNKDLDFLMRHGQGGTTTVQEEEEEEEEENGGEEEEEEEEEAPEEAKAGSKKKRKKGKKSKKK